VAVPSERQAFWPWAKGWLFATNHKRIGILYLWVTFVWFLFAGLDGVGVRAQLALPGDSIFKPDFYNGLFTFHGTQMLFLFAIPVFSAFANFFIPLMVGAEDMAFPRLNALSLWLVFWAGAILRLPLFLREFSTNGWTNYTPLSGLGSTPSLAEDWWIWAVFLETIASTLGGINFLVTIVRERRPGMRFHDMPIFIWSMAGTSALVVLAGPFLLAALLCLFLDRHYGAHFFDMALPGSTLLWQNLFWFYSHPATYVMVLPAFGILTHVISTFSQKAIFNYRAAAYAIMGTTLFSMLVFWHHMFTTGMNVDQSVFGQFMTLGVSVPTAVIWFNWVATMRGGRIRFDSPMLFALGFMLLFGLGGIDGVFLASIPLDQDLHQTYWLIGHIHLVLFGGTVMGALTGVYYWFPEMFGRRLSEGLGKLHFWGVLIGASLTFLPMHSLGLDGMLRRYWSYPPQFQGLNFWETIGAFLTFAAFLVFLLNVLITLLRAPRDTDRPWSELPPTVPVTYRGAARRGVPGGGTQ
jgi:cytochrome c oxidase subunit 1